MFRAYGVLGLGFLVLVSELVSSSQNRQTTYIIQDNPNDSNLP